MLNFGVKTLIAMFFYGMVSGNTLSQEAQCGNFVSPQETAAPFSTIHLRVTDDDYQIIDVVAASLLRDKRFLKGIQPSTPRTFHSKPLILVDARTLPFMKNVLDTDNADLSHSPEEGTDRYSIPAEIKKNLLQRNTEPTTLLQFAYKSGAALISNAPMGSSEAEFNFYHLNLGWVRLWLPGYSQDGKTAVIRFFAGPCGGHNVCLLTKQGKGWRIKWRYTHHEQT